MKVSVSIFWVVFLLTVLSCRGSQINEERNAFGTGCNKRNCKELYDSGYKNSGVYCIDPDNQGAFLVYCDMVTDGGGWTVFQRRLDGIIDFYREWNDYKEGFGNKYTEYWLGLEQIRRMTSQQSYKLRVDLMDINGSWKYAEYSYFSVNSEALKYKLNLGTYSGTAGNSLDHHDDRKFTTKDQDNDDWSGNCAVSYQGAWWYGSCHNSNLNGKYLGPGTRKSDSNGIVWEHWKGNGYSLRRVEMKIRPA